MEIREGLYVSRALGPSVGECRRKTTASSFWVIKQALHTAQLWADLHLASTSLCVLFFFQEIAVFECPEGDMGSVPVTVLHCLTYPLFHIFMLPASLWVLGRVAPCAKQRVSWGLLD